MIYRGDRFIEFELKCERQGIAIDVSGEVYHNKKMYPRINATTIPIGKPILDGITLIYTHNVESHLHAEIGRALENQRVRNI